MSWRKRMLRGKKGFSRVRSRAKWSPRCTRLRFQVSILDAGTVHVMLACCKNLTSMNSMWDFLPCLCVPTYLSASAYIQWAAMSCPLREWPGCYCESFLRKGFDLCTEPNPTPVKALRCRVSTWVSWLTPGFFLCMRWRCAQQSSGTAGKAIYESVQMCRFKTCRCCFGNACERSKCLRHAHVRQEGYSNRFTSSLRQILLRAVPDTPRQMAACRRGISNRGTSTSRVSTSGFDVTRAVSPAFLRGKTLAEKLSAHKKLMRILLPWSRARV